MSKILYTAVLYILSPFVLLRLAWRGLNNPDYWRHWPQRFGWSTLQVPQCIWVHAVSVGETQAALPLIEALLQQYPQHPMLVTTTTPTGAARVRALFGERVSHCYIPYDLPAAVHRFLERAQPRIAVVMETEIWPNLYAQLHQRGIPVLLVNARLSLRSCTRYLKIKPLIRATLANLAQIAAQAPLDAAHFQQLGAASEQITVTGNMKFDIAPSTEVVALGQQLRDQLGRQRRIWVAASTHDGEETQLLDVFDQLQSQLKGQLLILVPRHLERFAAVYQLCIDRGYRVARHSAAQQPDMANIDIYLGDTMGELPVFFAASDVAFLGGSFAQVGGHNPLEASVLGKPVVYGPQMFNFAQIHQLLTEAGGARQVQTSAELSTLLVEWLNDGQLRDKIGRQGAQVVASNQGALRRVLALCAPYL